MLPTFVPGGNSSQQELAVEVELTISAKCLLNKDVLSKSDPMCVVYVQQSNRHAWIEQGRTERLVNTLNPEFATKITVGYHFEELQNLKFKLYDIDGSSSILEDHDFLGEADCSLGQIVSSGNFSIPLHHPNSPNVKNKGQLFVKAEEIGSLNKEEVELLFTAQDFKKIFIFSKPDPFIEIYKEDTLVYRTACVRNNQHPQWPKFTLPLRSLRTKGDQDATLIIKALSHKDNGKHRPLGEVSISTREICSAPKTFNLIGKRAAKIVGKLNLQEATVKRTFSFLDYIKGGTQLSCTVAIDFTASNGSPNTVGSLHYIGPTPTLYEQALQSVVTIIQDYDSDKQFPVLGFGAKVPPTGNLSHEFYVNLNPSSPFCAGVAGVVEAYRRCLMSIQLHGPTNFAPVINHIKRFAANYPNGDNYFILLILTDGAISDMRDTKEAIIEASHLPVSIIIVGIGDADFSSMNELDGDNSQLTSPSGRCAARDIVQFVPFREFITNSNDPLFASQALAKALLAEVPSQLVAFMKTKNIIPNATTAS